MDVLITAILLSGGTGTRMNLSTPKQYLEVNDKPIICYSLYELLSCKRIDKLIVVADSKWHDLILDLINKHVSKNKFIGFSKPGLNRQLSIYNSLLDLNNISEEDDYVLIHDAARPLITQELINGLIQKSKNHDGAMPVLHVKDTMYYMNPDNKLSRLNRDCIYAGQSPEIFKYGLYKYANEQLISKSLLEDYKNNRCDEETIKSQHIYKVSGSTEPALAIVMDIAIIDGDENNFKISTMPDLEKFTDIIGRGDK